MGYIFKTGQLEGSFAGWLALSTSWSAVCRCGLRLSHEIRTTGGKNIGIWLQYVKDRIHFFFLYLKTELPLL